MPLSGAPTHIVGDEIAAGSVTYLEISGLDINADGAYQLYFEWLNSSASSDRCEVYFENDYTASNYYCQYHAVAGAAATNVRVNYPYLLYCAAGNTARLHAIIQRDPSGYATLASHGSLGTPSGITLQHCYVITKSTVSNITVVRINANTANIISAGSRMLMTRIAH